MPYGSNGYNTDGSSMNVNNVMGETRSIKLLGRQKGYDTGHAMAALLGIRSLTADEQEHQRADQHRERMQQRGGGGGGGGSTSGASSAAGSARRPNSHASHHEHAQRTPPQPHHHHHHAAASTRHQPHPHPHHHRRAPQQQEQQQQQSPLAVSPQQQQPGLRVGMKIITTKPIELHSGNSLPAGVVGTVCKVPGDLAGTVAEIDIPDGPLFDAWPGTIASLDDEGYVVLKDVPHHFPTPL